MLFGVDSNGVFLSMSGDGVLWRQQIGQGLAMVGCLVTLAGNSGAECFDEGVNPSSTLVALELAVGEICIELFGVEAPESVANFLDYLDRGEIDDSFIHRSVPGFIIQGGGYRVLGGVHEAVPIREGVVVPNEPCTPDTPVSEGSLTFVCSTRGNERGTLSLAKRGGQPDSGTTDWFINLADNRANLDNQNGGFTVFGRVLDDDMPVVDAIADLPLSSLEALQWRNSAVSYAMVTGSNDGGSSTLPLESVPALNSVEGGCFDGAELGVVVEPESPYLVSVVDPLDPSRVFFVSGACGELVDPVSYVEEPAEGECLNGSLLAAAVDVRVPLGSNQFSLALVPDASTGGYRYYSFSCTAAQTMLAERSAWEPDFNERFDAELVTILSAVRVPEPSFGLGGATALFAVVLMGRSRRRASG